MGMDGVRIRMVTAEIGLRLSVHHSACGRAEAIFKNGFSIGPCHGAQGVEAHAESGAKQMGNAVEVDEAFHQLRIIGHRIDDLDRASPRPVSPRRSRSMFGASTIL